MLNGGQKFQDENVNNEPKKPELLDKNKILEYLEQRKCNISKELSMKNPMGEWRNCLIWEMNSINTIQNHIENGIERFIFNHD